MRNKKCDMFMLTLIKLQIREEALHTGSKQSCVNCVKIFYRINLGHINRID